MQCDDGTRGTGKVQIGLQLKYKVIVLFRNLQRCRTIGDWPAAKAAFFAAVEDSVMQHKNTTDEDEDEKTDDDQDGDADIDLIAITQPLSTNTSMTPADRGRRQAQWKVLEKYFERNWFTDEWISM